MHNRLPVGTIVNGRYEITGLFGSGGFATVYKATQINIHRPVALKVLHLLQDDDPNRDVIMARFIREAESVARIDHPNVVAIYDVGLLGPGQPYIAMQPFEGRTLKNELRENGPLNPKRAIPLFCDALDALALAHAEGIVHRDLKPENLIIAWPGQRREALKIIDFGIAHLQHEGADLTQDDSRLGTPRYLSPEYIKDHHVSPALDVYQMGLILAEAMTGQVAVNGQNAFQCLLIHVEGAFNIPPTVWSSPLGPVLKRALCNNPHERYPNAAAFRDALEQLEMDALLDALDINALTSPISVDQSVRLAAARLANDTGELQLGQTPRPNASLQQQVQAVRDYAEGQQQMQTSGVFVQLPGQSAQGAGAADAAAPAKSTMLLGSLPSLPADNRPASARAIPGEDATIVDSNLPDLFAMADVAPRPPSGRATARRGSPASRSGANPPPPMLRSGAVPQIVEAAPERVSISGQVASETAEAAAQAAGGERYVAPPTSPDAAPPTTMFGAVSAEDLAKAAAARDADSDDKPSPVLIAVGVVLALLVILGMGVLVGQAL